jgi:hypothetical protein
MLSPREKLSNKDLLDIFSKNVSTVSGVGGPCRVLDARGFLDEIMKQSMDPKQGENSDNRVFIPNLQK